MMGKKERIAFTITILVVGLGLGSTLIMQDTKSAFNWGAGFVLYLLTFIIVVSEWRRGIKHES